MISECKRYSTQNVESVLSSVNNNMEDAGANGTFENDTIDGSQNS